VRFWDSSAVLPLIVKEAGSELCMKWLKEDATMLLWGLTRVELVSAIERRARDGALSSPQRKEALARVQRLANAAHEMTDLTAVRARATSLLARHSLRAADATQLGAALLISDPNPASLTMVVLDTRLAEAAEREGLDVLTWPT
jgi:uncharacterized protein